MSTIKVNTITNNGSAVDLPSGAFSIGGNNIIQNYIESATEPSSPSSGDIWWDSTNETLYFYLNGEFKEIGIVSELFWYGDRAVTAQSTTNFAYFSIPTPGNAATFGSFSSVTSGEAGCGLSNGSRIVWAGSNQTTLDYITASTLGNASTFGTVSAATRHNSSSSDGNYGLIHLGNNTNTIEYITVATTGNATDFGDAVTVKYAPASWSNGTRCITGGHTNSNVIEYVVFATPGNGTDFGDLTQSRHSLAAMGDGQRAIFSGGYLDSTDSIYNVMDYVTVETTGNATDFGDLTLARSYTSGASDGTYGVTVGGTGPSNRGQRVNNIDYVVIQTTGNATDFGDLVESGHSSSASGASA